MEGPALSHPTDDEAEGNVRDTRGAFWRLVAPSLTNLKKSDWWWSLNIWTFLCRALELPPDARAERRSAAAAPCDWARTLHPLRQPSSPYSASACIWPA